ncbi:MAG: hypothetical protein K1X52_11270 [Pyrinomonadaceae bacterium]|nr:hypothetical protein [Pyrinomonadaceae bacterium]
MNRRDFTAFGEEAVSVQRVGGGSGNGYEAAGAKQSVKVDGVKVTAGEGVATPAGYYKLVVFEGKSYLNTHVMKQESDGTWSSKNGDGSRFSGIKDANAFYQSAYGPASVKPTYFFRKISRLGRR